MFFFCFKLNFGWEKYNVVKNYIIGLFLYIIGCLNLFYMNYYGNFKMVNENKKWIFYSNFFVLFGSKKNLNFILRNLFLISVFWDFDIWKFVKF